jgi:hypothetical protein
LGERSSGTNLVKRLLGRNCAMTPTETLGWKHAPPGMMAIPPDLAVICVVRGAAGWALSMHAKPWHTTPKMQALEFSDFLRARWDTIIDRPRYFAGARQAGLIGQALQPDRDPLTGRPFANLFALRRAKLTALLGIPNRGCNCVILRLEKVQAAPEASLDAILKALDQPRRGAPFRAVAKRLGSKFKPAVDARPDTPARLSPADHAFMLSQLDPKLEAQLGYAYRLASNHDPGAAGPPANR